MKHMYSLAALLLFMLPASAQQEERVITEEPLCLVSADSVSSGQSGKQLFILHTSDTHSRIEPISAEAADEYAGMGGVVRPCRFCKAVSRQASGYVAAGLRRHLARHPLL